MSNVVPVQPATGKGHMIDVYIGNIVVCSEIRIQGIEIKLPRFFVGKCLTWNRATGCRLCWIRCRIKKDELNGQRK
jgi:hypothetical protein